MVISFVPRKILGVIPARFSSTRFPGKVLVPIAGRPMLQHVWERASRSVYITSVVIATDDERVRESAAGFGARVRMTRADHPSGTDRVAEVARDDDAEIVVNIQGDEPLIDPAAIDAAVRPLIEDPDLVMSTLGKRIEDAREVGDPNVVKVVAGRNGDAICFSRCAIPFDRDKTGCVPHFKHIGLYAYRRDFLLAYPGLPVGPLETAERLEQLRALENGYRIRVVETGYDSLGVDTPGDLERVLRLLDASILQGKGNG